MQNYPPAGSCAGSLLKQKTQAAAGMKAAKEAGEATAQVAGS